MVNFRLIDNNALLFAEEMENDNIIFEGTVEIWENCYGGLGGTEEEKLSYIAEWANDEMDAYLKRI